mmetsp:Transcript_34075/g.53124  ORF Transcript_34075/g.53124 Transcript_34075/m.53124 type:complete len:89 (+) Transcript_34075:747-1013(+)
MLALVKADRMAKGLGGVVDMGARQSRRGGAPGHNRMGPKDTAQAQSGSEVACMKAAMSTGDKVATVAMGELLHLQNTSHTDVNASNKG